ncbi:MAG: D-2-hydroxyacid dehydrogenase, partial [Verrucomicrobia bacterium]|nr:D-2-hydroxyacid dehydrogenase [Verrucomicrobiota bacterium]
MKIVVLDGFTLNPGDLSWQPIEALGNCTFHERTAPSELLERAADSEILLTNKTPIPRSAIEALPKLRYIGILATGYNIVDVDAARDHGIPVCNVPDYGTPNVAQAVFALLLELANRTGHHAQTVRSRRWSASKDFCYWDGSLLELQGLTLGIIGFGRIGRRVQTIARAFGMRTLACRSQSRTQTPSQSHSDDPAHSEVDLEELLRQSDVISLHCPLTEHTAELINAKRLAQMKPTAILINTARGALINETDLATALNEGRIAGAGLDVLSTEPPPHDHPLLDAKNCIITPHIAWATRSARERLLATAADNLGAWLRNEPRN